MEIGRRLPFRDIARPVHPDEEERHPLRARPLQGREAVAGGLKPDIEALGQKRDVVTLGLGGGQEGLVRQDQGARIGVGQPDPQ